MQIKIYSSKLAGVDHVHIKGFGPVVILNAKNALIILKLKHGWQSLKCNNSGVG